MQRRMCRTSALHTPALLYLCPYQVSLSVLSALFSGNVPPCLAAKVGIPHSEAQAHDGERPEGAPGAGQLAAGRVKW